MKMKILFFLILFKNMVPLLTNGDEICFTLKTNLFRTIEAFKAMKKLDKERLFKFSMRKIVYNIMETVEFQDPNETAGLKTVLESIKKNRERFEKWKNIPEEEIKTLQIEYIGDGIYASNKIKANDDLINETKTNLNTKKNKLQELKEKILNEDPDFMKKIQLLQNLKSSEAMIKVIDDSEPDTIVPIIQRTEILFEEKDVKAKELILNFKIKLNDISILLKIINNDKEIKKDFSFTDSEEIIKDLSVIKTEMATLKSELNGLKAGLETELQTMISSLQSEFSSNSSYQEYIIILKEAKKLTQTLTTAENIGHNNKHALILAHFKFDTLENQTPRIRHNEIIDFETKLYNLKNLIEMNSDNYNDKEIEKESVKVSAKNYFDHNTIRKEELEAEYSKINDEWNIISSLKQDEMNLDSFFGKVFAYLQGGGSDNLNFPKCFFNFDLSNYMFFMSLFQIIVSKKNFYLNLMSHLPKSDQILLEKQIYKDLDKLPYNEDNFNDEQNGDFMLTGLEKSMNNYVIMVNTEIDNIFKEQRSSEIDQNKTWFNSIIQTAGVSAEFLWSIFKKGSMSIMFKLITVSILAFFSVTHVAAFALVFITAFLSYFYTLLISWIGNKLYEYSWVLDEISEGIADIYSSFAKDRVDSLEFDEILKHEQTMEYKKLIDEKKSKQKEKEETIEVFKKNFNQIWAEQVEVMYDNKQKEIDEQNKAQQVANKKSLVVI